MKEANVIKVEQFINKTFLKNVYTILMKRVFVIVIF